MAKAVGFTNKADYINSDAVESYDSVRMNKSTALEVGQFMGRGPFYNTDTNISIKSEYNRADYNWYRPSEMVPNKQEYVIGMCMTAYDKVGIVRNVIDLMGDFACQGINLVHPNKQIEKFYQKWFKKINGKDRAERFLNMIYRCGNVVVRRFNAKIPSSSIDEWRKAYGKDIDDEFENIEAKRNVIPSKYVFYNPLAVEVVGGELGAFIGKPVFGIRITAGLKNMINRFGQMTNAPDIMNMYQNIPYDLTNAITSGARYIPVDQENISAFHYKKDDWLVWANPMLASVLSDLIHYEKLQLADDSALDGCISTVRLWNLGVLDGENSIFPTRTSITKLRNILAQNVGGGTLDLVWGPELKFQETASQAYHFLSPEKYTVTLNNIYAGLGIPPSLVAGTGKDGSFTNNYISIKTMVERLEYGRDVLKNWLNAEIERVQKAMGFRFPAQVVFDQMILSDEAAEKALLIQLADRDIISTETLRGKFDIISDIEKIRIKRDKSDIDNGHAPPKAGAFHNPQADHELNKIALQRGSVAPSEVGMNLKPKKEGEKTPLEQQHEQNLEMADKNNRAKIEQQKFKPAKPNGRPKNTKDSQKRKKKRVLPKTKGYVNLVMWANAAQKQISDIVTPIILESSGKKNVRALSSSEFQEMEFLKFDILTRVNAFDNITKENVYSIIAQEFNPDNEIHENFSILKAEFLNMTGREPNLEEIKNLQSCAFAAKYEEED